MSPVYRFRDFQLNSATRELRGPDGAIELHASAFDCLLYLITHRERAVGRDELMAAVWGRADVADSLLGQTVLKVRRVLGDTGSEQHSIRTVPRFGYRWIAPVDSSSDVVVETGGFDSTAAQALHSAPIRYLSDSNPITVRLPRPRIIAFVAGAVFLAIACLGILAVLLRPTAPSGAPGTSTTISTPAVVLPALVDAGEDWRWLRLGLMDLIAGRLRRGNLGTAASETVVALARGNSEADVAALLDSAQFADSTLRILPRVRRHGDEWDVSLTVRGNGREWIVETRHRDALVAARDAADTLLVRLGHTPGSSPDSSNALAELLQRTRAAMLSDQLQLAGDLIRRADASLREQPEITLRLAQIELRAGDYDSVEQRIGDLLDRVPAATDPALRGRALNTLAASYVRRDRADEAQRSYDEAIALLTDRQEPDALGLSLLGRGLVATMRGDHARAIADLGLARSEMEAAGNALGTAQVDLNLGLIDVLRGRPASALSALEDATLRFGRMGAQEEHVFSLVSTAEVHQLLLDHDAALAVTDRYWPPESHTQNRRLRWKLTLVRAEALGEKGRLDEAQTQAEHLLRESDPDADAGTRAETAALLAHLALARGDPGEAARRARGALTPTLQASDQCRYTAAWMTRLRALRASGAAAEAATETREWRDWVAAHPDPWRQIYADLALAEQAAGEGRHRDALPYFERSLTQVDRTGAVPADLVQVLAGYLPSLIALGRRDEARALSARIARWADTDWRAAAAFVAINDALGATPARERAQARWTSLAGQRHRTPATP
ncbi:winged helix-turn-helix domain-containing protein [Tahibacter amnicola]|uniref:Winged helix-turn-helix domain-containing protein n=1 Tax=Tahibacter amnicola TaxID=2976241 RepID=A0ABY6BN45_9GAMM|nr:winged helix-turn-helix domain-containing protein [Tahibacter amnicola]UXI69805.1 winged helix-turn-helix domain-containing protein [Tahibacter amnicola]